MVRTFLGAVIGLFLFASYGNGAITMPDITACNSYVTHSTVMRFYGSATVSNGLIGATEFDPANAAFTRTNPSAACSSAVDATILSVSQNCDVSTGSVTLETQTFAPGVFCGTSSLAFSDGVFTFDGQGDATSVFAVYSTGIMRLGLGSTFRWINGALPARTFFVTDFAAMTLGHTGSAVSGLYSGIFMSKNQISIQESSVWGQVLLLSESVPIPRAIELTTTVALNRNFLSTVVSSSAASQSSSAVAQSSSAAAQSSSAAAQSSSAAAQSSSAAAQSSSAAAQSSSAAAQSSGAAAQSSSAAAQSSSAAAQSSSAAAQSSTGMMPMATAVGSSTGVNDSYAIFASSSTAPALNSTLVIARGVGKSGNANTWVLPVVVSTVSLFLLCLLWVLLLPWAHKCIQKMRGYKQDTSESLA